MGAGYHGGFGKTYGSKSRQNVSQENKSLKKSATIERNVKAMCLEFPLTNGKFGQKGKNCRIIYSENQYKTALRFYKLISKGGIERDLPNNKGKIVFLSDKTIIVYRKYTSTKDSPAIEITIKHPSDIKGQKIHFEKEKQNG